MEAKHKATNNSVLSSMDITVIHFLREKNLRPKDVGEFFESLKILDEDKRVVESLLGHTTRIYLSIFDMYKDKDEKQLKIIINNITI